MQRVSTTPIFPSTSGRSMENDVITSDSSAKLPKTTTQKGVYEMQQMNSSTNFVIIFGVFSGLLCVILLVILLHCVVVKFRRRHLAQLDGRIYCSVTESAPALPPPRFTRRHTSLACASPPACHTGSCVEDNCDNTTATFKNKHIMKGEVFSEAGDILNQLGVDSTMYADTYACVPDPLGKQCFDDGGETDNTKISKHLGVVMSASRSDGDHKDAIPLKPRVNTGRRYGQEESQYVCSTADHNRLTRGGFVEGSHDDTSPKGIRTKRRYDEDYVNVPSINTVICDDSSSSTSSSRSGLEDSGSSNSSNQHPGRCPHSKRALKSIDFSGLPRSQVAGSSSDSSSTILTEDSRFPSCNIDEFGYLILSTSSPKCGGSRHNLQSESHDDELRFPQYSSNGHDDWTTSGRLHMSPSQRSSRESLSSSSPLEHTYLDREMS
ncbi:uncharacterized protein LOC105440353 [Strongylocentrotus purpuratus]|uniref:Uncharacterized protein n=1 Tax=Strongylocentrotus purpuratus TaxID=7668 RepID=A0A7M7STN2_STRPU|nr:uncharacterized protein LOC105440353 [Strongylocentrotus purpuratus]